MANPAWHRAQSRLFAPAEAPLHESQIAHRIIAQGITNAVQNLGFHQVELLNPHRARNFDNCSVELKRNHLGPTGDRFTHRFGPDSYQADDIEVSVAV